MSAPDGNGRGKPPAVEARTLIVVLVTVIIAVVSGWEMLRLRIDALRDKRIDDMSQAIWMIERDRRDIVARLEREQGKHSQAISTLQTQVQTLIGLEVKRVPTRPAVRGLVETP